MTNQSLESLNLESLEADLAILEAEFEELGLGEDDAPEFAALDAALSGTEFEVLADSEFMSLSLSGDPAVDALFIKFIINKAKKLIKTIVKLVKKHKSCVSCVPLVIDAVVAFKAGDIADAVSKAFKAYKCIKKCLK